MRRIQIALALTIIILIVVVMFVLIRNYSSYQLFKLDQTLLSNHGIEKTIAVTKNEKARVNQVLILVDELHLNDVVFLAQNKQLFQNTFINANIMFDTVAESGTFKVKYVTGTFDYIFDLTNEIQENPFNENVQLLVRASGKILSRNMTCLKNINDKQFSIAGYELYNILGDKQTWFYKKRFISGAGTLTVPGIKPGSIVIVNFSSDSHIQLQLKNNNELKKLNLNAILSFGPNDLTTRGKTTMSKDELKKYETRGFNWWRWKPMIIKMVMESCNADYIIYCDSSTKLTMEIDVIKNLLDQKPILVFHNPGGWWEHQWTKRDVFVKVCGEANIEEQNRIAHIEQIVATVVMFKNNIVSKNMTNDWSELVLDENDIVTDCANKLGYENFPGFIDHRHDQSCLSVLCKSKFKNHINTLPMQNSWVHHYYG